MRKAVLAAVVALVSISGISTSSCAQAPDPGGRDFAPPPLRIPAGARPTRYELTLTAIPGDAKPPGEITIDVELDQAHRVLWLNADAITVTHASVSTAATEVTVLPGNEQFIGLAFEPALPAGKHRLTLVSGAEQTRNSTRGVFAPQRSPVPLTDLLKASPAGDWQALDPQNLMVVELPAGRVMIELAPDYAPANVAAVRALVREGYFDGSFVVRAQDNYVVQWARLEEDERAKAMATRPLKAEFDRAIDRKLPFTRLPYQDTYAPEVGFSMGFRVARDPKQQRTWLVHCYGSVGVGRDNAADSGNGSELYAVIGHSPRPLDRNVTLVGRVLQGIELFSVMPRGTGTLGFYEQPSERIPIRSVRMMADVPAGERVELEALRTESATFRTLIESRVNRREEWFKYRAGRIDVCSVPLPVRVKAVPANAR